MTALALCSLVFLLLLGTTLSIALSKTEKAWLSSGATIVAASFVLTSTLGFILTNHLLEIPYPIAFAVIIIFAGAVFLELAQLIIVKEKASLMDIVFVLFGLCLFLLARYVMHETGRRIIDQFETLID